MSKLSNVASRRASARKPKKRRPKARALKFVALALVPVVLLLFILVSAATAFYVISSLQDDEPEFIEVTATTSSTSTSTITTPTTSLRPTALPATSTTLYTTTTIDCGGDYQEPCVVDGDTICGKGMVLGSDFLCKPVECAPTKPSGKSGCGVWALNWCQ